MLLQIANKIQNGALNCEEKLTLAKNTLQAVSLTVSSHMFMSHVFYSSSCAVMVNVNSWGIQLRLSWNCSGPLGSLGPSGWEQRELSPSHSPFLSQDAAHLESGQPVQCESDVIMYIQECEGLIRQLQVDLQILRDENYYQLEELAFRWATWYSNRGPDHYWFSDIKSQALNLTAWTLEISVSLGMLQVFEAGKFSW